MTHYLLEYSGSK